MKSDAFDSVGCPFDYKRQLWEAREFLNAKVGKYAWDSRDRKTERIGYRKLAREFGISTGLLCQIMRNYRRAKGYSRALAWVGRVPRSMIRSDPWQASAERAAKKNSPH